MQTNDAIINQTFVLHQIRASSKLQHLELWLGLPNSGYLHPKVQLQMGKPEVLTLVFVPEVAAHREGASPSMAARAGWTGNNLFLKQSRKKELRELFSLEQPPGVTESSHPSPAKPH